MLPFERRDAPPLVSLNDRPLVQHQPAPPAKRARGTLERIADDYVITLPVGMGAQDAENLCRALIKGAFPTSTARAP